MVNAKIQSEWLANEEKMLDRAWLLWNIAAVKPVKTVYGLKKH